MCWAGAVCLAAALVSSCATTPRVPDWVVTTPPADGTYTYFVGSSTGIDMGTASGDATNTLIASIMQYMGVSVKVSTSATAKASIDEYSASIRQTVETESTNRLVGFQVVQKFMQTEKATGKITVHILAKYATAELQKEKARIAALLQEKVDAVARPEAEGDALVSQGRVFDAINRYIDAMVAASGSDIENASIKLERNANKARTQIASLGFSIGAGQELFGTLGAIPPQPLEISIFSDRGGVQSSVAGAQLLVSYPRKLANGKLGSKSQTLFTDINGTTKLALPAPDFAGKGRITVQLDLSSALELLDKLGVQHEALRSSIEDEIINKIVEVRYTVVSAARTIPTAISVIDLDEKGVPSGLGATQSGLMEALSKDGFQVQTYASDGGLLVSGLDAQILAEARSVLPKTVKRIIYGVGRIESVRKDGSYFIGAAAGSLKAVDLVTGQILYTAEKTVLALGSDEAVARRNALRDLGAKVFGAEIVSSLP